MKRLLKYFQVPSPVEWQRNVRPLLKHIQLSCWISISVSIVSGNNLQVHTYNIWLSCMLGTKNYVLQNNVFVKVDICAYLTIDALAGILCQKDTAKSQMISLFHWRVFQWSYVRMPQLKRNCPECVRLVVIYFTNAMLSIFFLPTHFIW